MTIRPATPADAPALADLITQLGYPTDVADVPARLARLGADGRAAALVAIDDGRLVGLATVHVLHLLNHARPLAELSLLVVDEEARGTGIGRSLVQAVEAYARDAGCEKVTVTTHEDRAGARAFYPAVGFEPTGRRFGKGL